VLLYSYFTYLRFGFVDYPSCEEAGEALNLNVNIGGQVLVIGERKRPGKPLTA